jgi:hypothetical protein
MNKMKTKIIASLLVLLFITGALSAQQTTETKPQNIFESLSKSDSATNATVILHQDKRIEQLLLNKRTKTFSQSQTSASGYRVQVFSSNTQRTAKNEAFKIEKQIKEMFPYEEVYVNYTSPFWKVRVGDFESMSSAQAFRLQLIEAFPELKSETYIVREQINISGTK